jgi:hypothetical protein
MWPGIVHKIECATAVDTPEQNDEFSACTLL